MEATTPDPAPEIRPQVSVATTTCLTATAHLFSSQDSLVTFSKVVLGDVCETLVYRGCPHILSVLTFFLQVTREGGQRAQGLCARACQSSTAEDTIMKAKGSRDSPKDSSR